MYAPKSTMKKYSNAKDKGSHLNRMLKANIVYLFFAFMFGMLFGMGLTSTMRTPIATEIQTRPTETSNTQSVVPRAFDQYIAKSAERSAVDSQMGENGGEWTWCTHLVKYGPNFDRGLANFLSGILRPRSANLRVMYVCVVVYLH
eukprot:942212_1